MEIIVDANIPFADEAFSQFGKVRKLPGRDLCREDLGPAEALIVRSVTRVDASLLEGSGVRFVGTATIGTDHLDIPWLNEKGIAWRSAAGCNARSVVEWVIAALVEYCLSARLDFRGMTLGIVGCGNIGSRLADVARAIGMKVLINDPPKAKAGIISDSCNLHTLIAESDFVTVHVPYERSGEHATHHLIGWDELDLLRPHAVLLNSSRGAVLDNEAALTFLKGDSARLILDVFENEPTPNRDLVKMAFLTTPHIAGYSFEGKVNGTTIMAEALGNFLESPSTWEAKLPAPNSPAVTVDSIRPMLALQQAVKASYDIQADNYQLREGLSKETESDWGAHFDGLRKNYPRRREFSNYQVNLENDSQEIQTLIKALGFKVA